MQRHDLSPTNAETTDDERGLRPGNGCYRLVSGGRARGPSRCRCPKLGCLRLCISRKLLFIRDGSDTPKLALAGLVVGAALRRDGLSESRRKAAPTICLQRLGARPEDLGSYTKCRVAHRPVTQRGPGLVISTRVAAAARRLPAPRRPPSDRECCPGDRR